MSRLLAGVLLVAPIYLAGLLLLKAANSMAGAVQPFIHLLPEWMPAQRILSLLLVLAGCFLVGAAVRTASGEALWARFETALLVKVPGYELVRGLTRRLSGSTLDCSWKPALAEVEEALVPAFIIEELGDGRFTVFVPSVPTPLAGAIYVLTPDRVHPVDVPLAQAMLTLSRWGSGTKKLVAAMDRQEGAMNASRRSGPSA